MSVLRANVDYAWSIVRPRDHKPYGYGGTWSRTDVNRTTDCSGIVTHVLDALINGDRMAWSRHGISTEAYRVNGSGLIPVGGRGPFGTIRVARPQDIPGDAALRIGLQHGGGGRNSHMACTLEGIAIESSGSYGQRVGGPARGYNHPMFHAWAYLPGPIVGSGATPPAAPQAPGAIYLGEQYENVGGRVLALQKRLNADGRLERLDEDGEFGPLTAAAVRQYQQLERLEIDGIAGPQTLAALGLFQPDPPAPPKPKRFPQDFSDRELLERIAVDTAENRKQLSPEGDPSWKNRGASPRDLTYAIAAKVGALAPKVVDPDA